MPLLCQQCQFPGCYYNCPLRDKALCIDRKTGARYIDEDNCVGCMQCINGCVLDPPRVSLDIDTGIPFKCDLCKDRPEGPVCVEVCDRGALTFVQRQERHGKVRRIRRENPES
jgi:Fe-S-cluster-containing dehydrogenase component